MKLDRLGLVARIVFLAVGPNVFRTHLKLTGPPLSPLQASATLMFLGKNSVQLRVVKGPIQRLQKCYNTYVGLIHYKLGWHKKGP